MSLPIKGTGRKEKVGGGCMAKGTEKENASHPSLGSVAGSPRNGAKGIQEPRPIVSLYREGEKTKRRQGQGIKKGKKRS